ncbi:MAG: tripartite tricarboxylate transporter substrate binding protein [Candidatus Caldatribacteriota bacterium]
MCIKKKITTIFLFSLVLILIMGFNSWAAQDEEFPTKPIKLIVHTKAGGGADTNIRTLQPYLEAELGVPLIIENRPGAGSLMGPKLVSESEPDGYTIGMAGSPYTEVGLLTMEGMFEPDDIVFLASLTLDAAAILVRKDAPWNTLEEFIADAKKRPGEIVASVGNVTGDNYLGLRMIEEETGIDLNIVSFGGGSAARLALAGGHVDVTHASLFASQQIAESTKVLAVHWEKNYWPDISNNAPTVVELIPGIDKVNCGTMDLLVAPAGLKEKYPKRYLFLANAIEKAIHNPEFQEKLKEAGRQGLWYYMSSMEMTKYFKQNMNEYRNFLHFFEEEVEEVKK